MRKLIRHLSLLLLAALVAVMVLVPSGAKPAHAVGAACWPFDTIGQTYYEDGWYKSASQSVYDTSRGVNVAVNTDLALWRESDSDGHCRRGMYVSSWTGDGSSATWNNHLRVWACGSFRESSSSGNVTGSRNQWVSGFDSYMRYLTLPSGQQGWVGFYDYGTSPCGAQADNLDTTASNVYWSSSPTSVSGGNWYLNY